MLGIYLVSKRSNSKSKNLLNILWWIYDDNGLTVWTVFQVIYNCIVREPIASQLFMERTKQLHSFNDLEKAFYSYEIKTPIADTCRIGGKEA